MKDFVSRHPILFSLIVIVAYDPGLTSLFSALAGSKRVQLPVLLIAQAVLCGYVIILLTRLRWWRDAGFTRRVTWRALLVYLPWLILPLLSLTEANLHAAKGGRVVGFAVFTLMVGFAEEGLLRGVVLRALLPGGVMRAALLSSLFFGIAHLSNMFQGHDPGSTIVQAVYATFIGIGFAGPRLYTGTIVPAVAFHALIDFSDFASRGFAPLIEAKPVTPVQAIVVIVITGLYALYGWWLLRRHLGASPARAGQQNTGHDATA
jgi:membrane protease YdiL (CAAX protease family)